MFPKKHRFDSRLSAVFFSSSKKLYSPLFIVFFQKRIDSLVKAAIIVPKKRVPKAVDRSIIKRRVRATLTPLLGKKTGLNLVFYLKKKPVNVDEINKEIEQIFKKIV